MRHVAISLLALAAVGCAGASAADRITVRLTARPGTVTVGVPWTARLVVTPATAGRAATARA